MNTTKNGHGAEDLTRSGLKITKRRTAILNILEQSDRPLSAEQVFIKLNKKDVSANLSTVYRALEALSEKGLASRLTLAGDQRTLFEYNRLVHKHYLVCLGCKKITAIEQCPLKEYVQSLEQKTQYAIAGHQLDLYGYCPECREKGGGGKKKGE